MPQIILPLNEVPLTTHLHHVVVGMAVRVNQPLSRRELVHDHVDVAALSVVVVGSVIDNWCRG